MDSVLNVLAMVGGRLVLGWLVGSGGDDGAHARPGTEPPLEQLEARPASLKNR